MTCGNAGPVTRDGIKKGLIYIFCYMNCLKWYLKEVIGVFSQCNVIKRRKAMEELQSETQNDGEGASCLHDFGPELSKIAGGALETRRIFPSDE